MTDTLIDVPIIGYTYVYLSGIIPLLFRVAKKIFFFRTLRLIECEILSLYISFVNKLERMILL